MTADPIFKNREVLQPSYRPTELPHRERELEQIAAILAPALHGDTPSNVMVYGITGTGKTACCHAMGEALVAAGKNMEASIEYAYVNCKLVPTPYRVLTHLANHFIGSWESRLPITGWPTDEVYRRFRDAADKTGANVLVALDEVDLLSERGEGVLYHLSRMNEELKEARISIIGISNDLRFMENLDPRIRSSLGREEVVFHPYNGEQLSDILGKRTELAFRPGVFEDGVVQLCAALAAREHGDARRAIDLLRVSAELAERQRATRITEDHVRMAHTKLEKDRVIEVVRTLPLQTKVVLLAIVRGTQGLKGAALTTGTVYEFYTHYCKTINLDRLTQRRVTDLVSELDTVGLVHARVRSRGRRGRTKEILPAADVPSLLRALTEDTTLAPIVEAQAPWEQGNLWGE